MEKIDNTELKNTQKNHKVVADIIKWNEIEKRFNDIIEPIFTRAIIEKQKKKNRSLKDWEENDEGSNRTRP